MKLYAELQTNPRSIAAYKKLQEFYRLSGKQNEAEAFVELIRKKFNDNSADIDEKQ